MVLNYILVGCPWLRSRINVFKQSVFFIGWSCGQIGRYLWRCGQLRLFHLHPHFPLEDLRCACFPSKKAALNLSELLGLTLYVDTILNSLKSYFWCCWQVERKRCRGKHATLLDSIGDNIYIIFVIWRHYIYFIIFVGDIIHSSLYFTRFSNIHNYSTRQCMRLSPPNVKQNFRKRTFLFTGAKFFSKLHLNIVKSENIQTFCRRARHFFFS